MMDEDFGANPGMMTILVTVRFGCGLRKRCASTLGVASSESFWSFVQFGAMEMAFLCCPSRVSRVSDGRLILNTLRKECLSLSFASFGCSMRTLFEVVEDERCGDDEVEVSLD